MCQGFRGLPRSRTKSPCWLTYSCRKLPQPSHERSVFPSLQNAVVEVERTEHGSTDVAKLERQRPQLVFGNLRIIRGQNIPQQVVAREYQPFVQYGIGTGGGFQWRKTPGKRRPIDGVCPIAAGCDQLSRAPVSCGWRSARNSSSLRR